jgi:hypothetical protein
LGILGFLLLFQVINHFFQVVVTQFLPIFNWQRPFFLGVGLGLRLFFIFSGLDSGRILFMDSLGVILDSLAFFNRRQFFFLVRKFPFLFLL